MIMAFLSMIFISEIQLLNFYSQYTENCIEVNDDSHEDSNSEDGSINEDMEVIKWTLSNIVTVQLYYSIACIYNIKSCALCNYHTHKVYTQFPC